jgi:serine/threonine-protein kinase
LRVAIPLVLLGGSLLASCGTSCTDRGGVFGFLGSSGSGARCLPPEPPGDGLFAAPNVWSAPVDAAPLHPDSAGLMARLAAQGGFGLGRVQIDFSIAVLEADATSPTAPLVPRPGYYLPDCESGLDVPLPVGGALEGETGYACAGGGDCHLLVVHRGAMRLFELYGANRLASGIEAQCAVTWDLARSYPPELRGDQCTSADAAGLPVAPLLFSADEVAAGVIEHAVRFILPNDRMRAGAYVRPATHAGAPSGPADALPYGSRLRLRAGYPLPSLPSDGARVVARALQRYGMILADGGSVALTARDDRFTSAKWAGVGIGARSLDALQPGDFEVVDTGPAIPLTYDCVRVP